MIPSSWITLAGPGGAGKNRDTCVSETVRRQLARPFTRSAAREAEVILERFPLYCGLRARKIETMRPLGAIVDELLGYLGAAT